MRDRGGALVTPKPTPTTQINKNRVLIARSWYYMEVFADPQDENIVYVLNAPLMKSIDGGKTFESMRVIHGDCHDFWINPENSQNFAMAEDGGATISYSGGNTWCTLYGSSGNS